MLANKMLGMNYPASSGDLGFQQFLYPDDKETRKMLSFLSQKMPKSGDGGDEIQGSNVQLFSDIKKELGAWKKKPWSPPHTPPCIPHRLPGWCGSAACPFRR